MGAPLAVKIQPGRDGCIFTAIKKAVLDGHCLESPK